jgi:hypothetical protein
MSDTLTTGPLAGWDSMLNIVTNGCGQIAVVAGQNEEAVLFGPTTDLHAVTEWVTDYMLLDADDEEPIV